MANPDDVRAAQRITNISPLDSAKVHLTGDNRLQVQFSIKDLVKRLMPGDELMSNCNGCRGCMGCGM